MEQWWIFLIAGVAMGVLSGTFGVGGGIIIVPALVILFATKQQTAQGLSLMAMVPIAIAGAIGYMFKQHGGLDWRIAAIIGVAGVAGSFVGTQIAHQLPQGTLRKTFAVFMVLMAFIMYFRDDIYRWTHVADRTATSAATPKVQDAPAAKPDAAPQTRH